MEAQVKAGKAKLKKTEVVLRKAIEALKRIGKEVAVSYQATSRRASL